jgi:hypothetical protein
MVKVQKIKNEFIEFDVFGSAKVFTLFQKQFGTSLVDHIGANPNDANAYAYALYFGHQSYCKLFKKDTKIEDADDILEAMDIQQLAIEVMNMLGFGNAQDSKKK